MAIHKVGKVAEAPEVVFDIPKPNLDDLNKKIQELLDQRAAILAETRGQVLAKMMQDIVLYSVTADELGFSMTVPSVPKPKKESTAKNPAPIKYRNPHNHAETWSGRGKKAAWLAKAIERGAKTEEFLVPQAEAEEQPA